MLFRSEILPYIVNDTNYDAFDELQEQLQKIITNLNSKPRGAGAAAFNIHDLLK